MEQSRTRPGRRTTYSRCLAGARPGEAARVRLGWPQCEAAHADDQEVQIRDRRDDTLELPLCRMLRSLPRPRHGYVLPGTRTQRSHGSLRCRWSAGVRERTAPHLCVGRCGGRDRRPDDPTTSTTHIPRGVSQKYFLHMIVVSGPAMRKAQARISAEIMKRAGDRSPGPGARC